jgi:hypothetical protein
MAAVQPGALAPGPDVTNKHMHKEVVQIDIKITAKCFGVNTPSSDSLQLC